MAAVEKRSGSYSARVSLTDPLTGKRKQVRVTTRTKRELDAKVAALKNSWNTGTYIEPNETPLREYLRAWLPKAGGKLSTQINRDQHVRVHLSPDPIADIPIGRLRLAHVQDFVDRKLASGLAVSYVKNLIATLSFAMARAVKVGAILANPCVGIEYPRMVRKGQSLKVYSETEARQLVAGVAGDDDAAFWILAVTIGLRRGELIALRWEDIDFERGTLSVNRTHSRGTETCWYIADAPKSESSRRTIPLPQVCIGALRSHRARQNERRLLLGADWADIGAVFDTGDGQHHRGPDGFNYRWRRLRDRLNLPPLTMHALRHTAATNALVRGMPVHVVAKMLGHANPAITLQTYAHVLPNVEREAIARIDALYA